MAKEKEETKRAVEVYLPFEQSIAELEKKNKTKPDVEPIESDGEGNSQTVNFLDAARQLAKDEKITVTEAMKRVRKDNPQLYEDSKNEAVA